MRTAEEIVQQIKGSKSLFGFEVSVWIVYLPFEQARQFLKPEADVSKWEYKEPTRENILSEMREYMAFAWSKVQDHRGLSANRSVEKMKAWLWLLEDQESFDFADDESNYAQYGAPILKHISEKYGFEIPESEEIERMARGESCGADFECGCG